MISIIKSQVPKSLQKSDFYGSLDEDGGEILIPRECFKTCMSVSSAGDLRELLSTLRFLDGRSHSMSPYSSTVEYRLLLLFRPHLIPLFV